MAHVHNYEDFYAFHNHMPGSDRATRVGGTVVFTTSGCSATLEAREGNTGINPQMLQLDLVITPPDPGSAVQEKLTTEKLKEWREEGTEIEYQEVVFRVVGTDDDTPPTINVEHPQ